MEKRAAAGWPAHDIDTEPSTRIAIDVALGLKASERERRWAPAVEAQGWSRASTDRVHQRDIAVHLLDAGRRHVDVVDEAPLVHPGQPLSTSARYAAASRSSSSSDGVSISITKIQPSPYGSWFSFSGAWSSAALASTTLPDTGA